MFWFLVESAIWAFDSIVNKHILYCGEGCMKKFWESLREHVKNILDFEKKKMLTKEGIKMQKYVIFVENEF